MFLANRSVSDYLGIAAQNYEKFPETAFHFPYEEIIQTFMLIINGFPAVKTNL